MNNKRIFFVALIFFAAIAACVVPGLSSGSAPVSAPVVEPGRLETMVAETVSAAIAQTEQAQPTLRPTSRPTSTSAPAASATPTPITIPSGSTLSTQADGSTVFTDERAGYEITVPVGWLTVRIHEQEYLDAFSLTQAANDQVQKSLLSIQNLDSNKFRLFSFDTQAGHIQNEFVININFVWQGQGAISLDTDKELKASAAQLTKTQPEREILSTKITSTKNAVPLGVIESKFAAKNSSGTDIVVFQKQVIFNAKTGTVVITLSSLESLKDTIVPAFDAMIETIKIVAK